MSSLSKQEVEIVLENNRSGKAPGCVGCGHLLLFHGAGRCAVPFSTCDCPSTSELWNASLAPVTADG